MVLISYASPFPLSTKLLAYHLQIFESYNEARIGFGTGHNVKTSVLQAINDCPFLGVDIKVRLI